MVETRPEVGVNNQDFADMMGKRQSRRELLKTAKKVGIVGIGAAVTHGTLLKLRDEGVIGTSTEIPREMSAPEVPFNEDPLIKGIEERLGIRLLTTKQVHKLFNEPYDEKKYGENLPEKWDHGRAEMLEEFFSLLPEYFHEPDQNGNPLLIALTDWSDTETAQGTYAVDKNLMNLEHKAFSLDHPEFSFDVLVHEGMHRLQDIERNRLEGKLAAVFGIDINIVADKTTEWIESKPNLDPKEKDFVIGNLLYGTTSVTLTSEDDKNRQWKEFEAILGNFYVHGEDFFIRNLRGPYGDTAERLYTYVRDNFFGGREYDKFPVT